MYFSKRIKTFLSDDTSIIFLQSSEYLVLAMEREALCIFELKAMSRVYWMFVMCKIP